MDLTGATDIPAPPERVWRGLNDAEILSRAIPGSEGVTRLTDTEFEAVASAAIGPVKARFKGKVALSNINPPSSYTISGEGSGGVAGFAKGSADVRLEPIPTGTRLHYTVKAQVGGKLAQIGQRLVDGAARKLADEFFMRFSQIVAEPVPMTQVPPTDSARSTPAQNGLPQIVWIPVLVTAVIAIVVAALVLT
jgi:carbon monoxide dehydrogenase subunit G